MNERKFNDEVIAFCKEHIHKMSKEKLIKSDILGELIIGDKLIYTGSIPWWTEEDETWYWHEFKRQIDLVIGIRGDFGGKESIIPLIAGELKVSSNINTAELDKKSAVYGPLRELYPWCHSLLIFYSADRKNEQFILRNARHFSTIYTSWDEDTKKLLKKLLEQQLEYQLDYWQLLE